MACTMFTVKRDHSWKIVHILGAQDIRSSCRAISDCGEQERHVSVSLRKGVSASLQLRAALLSAVWRMRAIPSQGSIIPGLSKSLTRGSGARTHAGATSLGCAGRRASRARTAGLAGRRGGPSVACSIVRRVRVRRRSLRGRSSRAPGNHFGFGSWPCGL